MPGLEGRPWVVDRPVEGCGHGGDEAGGSDAAGWVVEEVGWARATMTIWQGGRLRSARVREG